jgi:hypothetical protein
VASLSVTLNDFIFPFVVDIITPIYLNFMLGT